MTTRHENSIDLTLHEVPAEERSFAQLIRGHRQLLHTLTDAVEKPADLVDLELVADKDTLIFELRDQIHPEDRRQRSSGIKYAHYVEQINPVTRQQVVIGGVRESNEIGSPAVQVALFVVES